MTLESRCNEVSIRSPSLHYYNGTPLQYSCLENPMDRGAWWAAVHGVTKSRTRLSNFTFTFHFHALEKEMATHSSVLACRIPGMEEPGGLPSMGSHRVRHDWSNLAVAVALDFSILSLPLNYILLWLYLVSFPGPASVFWLPRFVIWQSVRCRAVRGRGWGVFLFFFPSTLGYFVQPRPNVASAIMTSASVWPVQDF